jgi:3-deoxy-D-manno-octulosonate 8-phosphate phosphatase (KDO 8-P phosphatase)
VETSIILTDTPKVFLLDVDGVMTDGKFYYTAEGKTFKAFGADDHDALSLLKPILEILFLTGDKRGFPISKARIVDDMHMRLELVSTVKRIEWIKERWNPAEVIYMGDGIFDHYVFREVGYSIATANADELAKRSASFTTKRCGGDRAVAEASLHILERFFKAYDPSALPQGDIKLSGQWGV